MSAIDKPHVAAGGVFSDSWDVIPIVIGNLILCGIKDFFFVLHNSSNDFTHELQELFRGSASIHFLIKQSEPFFQGTMITFLADWARKEGFDIFIPTDSDEFLLTESSELNVVEVLSKWHLNTNSKSLKVPLLNFVQNSDAQDFNASSALNSSYLAVPRSEAMSETREAVLLGASIVNQGNENKVLFKLVPNLSLEIGEGSHNLILGGDYMEGDEQSDLFIAHLPYRSRNSISIKKRLGRNRISAQFQKDTGWQNQMLVKLNEAELDEIWSRNSFKVESDGTVRLAKGSDQLKFDDRLSVAISKVLDTFDYKGWMLEVHQKKGNLQLGGPSSIDTSLVLDVFGTHIRELTSTYSFKSQTAVAERDSAVAERDSAVAERDSAVAERDSAVAERDSILNSTIWSLFTSYRKAKNLFRKS